MANTTYKTTSGDYRITVGPVVGGNGTGTLTISGNLDVVGNLTYIETAELKIDDPFFTVAANNTGLIDQMGMLGQTGSNTYAGLRFNTITNDWEISPSVNADGTPITPYSAIATGGAVGGNSTEIQFNNAGTFAGNINLRFDYLNSRVIIDGQTVMGNIASTPAPISNSVTLYHKAPGEGETGLYVVSNSTDDEVTAYKKALLLSMIF